MLWWMCETTMLSCNIVAVHPCNNSLIFILLKLLTFDICYQYQSAISVTPHMKLVPCADWTYSEFLCCSFPCQHWNADPCSFSLEPCWYITGICYIGHNHKNSHNHCCCEGIWLQQQDSTSCKILWWLTGSIAFKNTSCWLRKPNYII